MLKFSHIFVLAILTTQLLVVLSKQYLIEAETGDNGVGRKTKLISF